MNGGLCVGGVHVDTDSVGEGCSSCVCILIYSTLIVCVCVCAGRGQSASQDEGVEPVEGGVKEGAADVYPPSTPKIVCPQSEAHHHTPQAHPLHIARVQCDIT